MQPLVTNAESRSYDRHTIDVVGVPSLSLMEVAGRAVAEETAKFEGAIVVVAGHGNNGGDGLVAARALAARGRDVRVLILDEKKIEGDAAVCLASALNAGVKVEAATPHRLQGAIVIDAIYGTGLSRPVQGEAAAMIAAINALGAPVVAVDIPSGLDADRGVPLGDAVRATTTVTFAFGKRGLYASPGFTYAGRVVVADIGIAHTLADGVKTRLLDASILDPYRTRTPLGHKGTHGHVLLVAGSVGKVGASLLAGRAALRGGAGLVTLATPVAAQGRVEGQLPELMTAAYAGLDDKNVDVERIATTLVGELHGKRVVAIGPGISTSPAFAEVVEKLVWHAVADDLSVVLDADALNHLSRRPSILEGRPGTGAVILTPHPGEAARLLGCKVPDIEADRFAAAAKIAERYAATVALKGARTIVATPDGRVAVCPTGGPILGVGGSGDVLTGTIAALLAGREQAAFETTCAGVYLHGATADRLARTLPDRGMLASELADGLPETLRA